MFSRAGAGLATVAVFVALASPAGANEIQPNIVSDDVDANDGHCSLREAVSAANNNAPSGGTLGECEGGVPDSTGPDTITLGAGTYAISWNTPASGTESANAEDDLDIVG